MKTRIVVIGLLIGVWASVQAQQAPPIRKVVLYKNGMGYFQHLAEVQGNAPLYLSLSSSRLNDVLKSLTLLDLDGGRIAGVSYDSAAPLDRRLEELAVDLTAVQQLVQFLNQVRGAGVEAEGVSGRLLGAELRTRVEGDRTSTQVVQLSIFSEDGQLRLVELERVGGLKLTDPQLAGDVQRWLELVDGDNRRKTRRLKIQTSGSGQRRLFVAYTSEAPVWKSTYRIVLDPADKPLLQGWAIVDNTTEMDWNEVELSLVAGAPISFVQNLSQPVYAKRPVVPLNLGVNVRPETHEGALGGLEEDKVALARPSEPVFETTEGIALEAGRNRRSLPLQGRDVFGLLDSAETAAAQAVGEQFEYRLRSPVTVGRNQSALLSVLQSEVDAEKVSVYNGSGNAPNPRLAIWLKNTSGLTLDGGAFTVIDENAFAGEGLVDTLQPNQRRLLSYAVDTAVEVSSKLGTEQRRVERVSVKRGVLRLIRKIVETKTYRIRNNADKDRAVIVEHPARSDWELLESIKPVETSANFYRFRVPVEAGAGKEFPVLEQRLEESAFGLVNINPEMIAVWVRDKAIDAETERELQKIVSQQAAISELTRQLAALEEERVRLFNDQKRIRDNLGRLGGTPDQSRLRQRYVEQLNEQEDRLVELEVLRQRLEEQRLAAQKALDDLIAELDFERNI